MASKGLNTKFFVQPLFAIVCITVNGFGTLVCSAFQGHRLACVLTSRCRPINVEQSPPRWRKIFWLQVQTKMCLPCHYVITSKWSWALACRCYFLGL